MATRAAVAPRGALASRGLASPSRSGAPSPLPPVPHAAPSPTPSAAFSFANGGMHEAPEAKSNVAEDASSKIRSRLEGLSTRFDGFEDELSLSRHRRKAEEDARLAALQTQLNNLQASLALESKNRAMSVKALQNWLTDRISQWTAEIEAPMTHRLDTLSSSLSALSARLDALEARQREDREIFPKLVDGRCEELLRELQTLKATVAQQAAQREEKEKRLLLKLQHESNRLAVQFAADKQIADDKLQALRVALDDEVAQRTRAADSIRTTLLEEVAALRAELATEKGAREAADEDLVQAVNHYAAALQDGIKLVV